MKAIKMTELTNKQVGDIIAKTNAIVDTLHVHGATNKEWTTIAIGEAEKAGVARCDFDQGIIETFEFKINQNYIDDMEAWDGEKRQEAFGDWDGAR